MKLAFSTRYVSAASFLELCDKTADYGYAGFEIFDAPGEKEDHNDSIFRSSLTATSRRKLINRHIAISAV